MIRLFMAACFFTTVALSAAFLGQDKGQQDGKSPVTVGTGSPNHGIKPVLSQHSSGSSSSYVTNSLPYAPYEYESLWLGTPQSIPAYSAYVHRIDLITKPNTDVQSSVAFGSIVTVHSTNSTGPKTYDNTAQVAIVANASAVDREASAPVEAINAIAGTSYTGTIPQHVIGLESDVVPNRDSTAEGGATGAFSIGGLFSNNANTPSMADGTFGVLSRGVTANNSWKTAGYFSGRLVGVASGTNAGVTPDVGFWVRNAATWGIYIGSRAIESSKFFNSDMTLGNPSVGIELGETGNTLAPSNKLRFSARNRAGTQQMWDQFTDADGIYHMQFNGSDKILIMPSGELRGGASIAVRSAGSSSPVAATLTTTAAASDDLRLMGMTDSGHCSITAVDASSAAHFASTFISGKMTNSVTVNHAPIAGMHYDILCTVN